MDNLKKVGKKRGKRGFVGEKGFCRGNGYRREKGGEGAEQRKKPIQENKREKTNVMTKEKWLK